MLPKGSHYCILFFLCLSVGCSEKIEPGTTAQKPGTAVKTQVATAEVIRRPLIYEALGTVKARTSSTLSSKILGVVKAVKVLEGDRVKQGDLLVVLDGRQVTARLREAQAALGEAGRSQAAAMSARDAARTAAELAQATFQRYNGLMQQESTSLQEFDEVKARHHEAQAAVARAEAMLSAASHRVEQAKAAVSAAQAGRDDANVRATYDGTVTAKLVEPGDLAAPGTPLVVIEQTGTFRVEFSIPESHIHFVDLEQKVAVRVDALKETVLQGVVKTIVPAADRGSRTFLVKADLPPNQNLRSGMFARVTVPMGDAGMLLIPFEAVIHQGQLTGVFVLEADQIARFRLVRIGRTFGHAVEVISGLNAGIRYVVKPDSKLVDGARVEVGS